MFPNKKRLPDYDKRRFLDEFQFVKASRNRALGIIDPAKPHAVIPFPDGTQKLIAVQHTKLKYGGGWSFFRCPKCSTRTSKLYCVDGAPICTHCCQKANIKERARYGLTNADRRKARELHLDQLIAKLTTTEPIMLKTPEVYYGRAKLVQNSRGLTRSVRRGMIALRLKQLIGETNAGKTIKSLNRKAQPLAAANELIDLRTVRSIWQAKTIEQLDQALDKAQQIILQALQSDNPRRRLMAVQLMLRTRQARERGL